MGIILHTLCSLRSFNTYLCKSKLHIMNRISSHICVKFSIAVRIFLECVYIKIYFKKFFHTFLSKNKKLTERYINIEAICIDQLKLGHL